MAEQRDCPDLVKDTAEDINQHRLVRFDSNGDFVYCDAGEYPVGAARNFEASGNPLTAWLLERKQGTLKVVAAGAVSLLDDVYTAADGKVSTTNSGVRVGKALVAASGDNSVIEVLPDVDRVPMVNTAASAVAGASSTSEEDFDKTFSIPADELKAGSIIRVRLEGILVSTDTTPQCDVKLYAGTEVIAQVTVASAADNDEFAILADIVVRSVGASGKLVAFVAEAFDAAGTALGTANLAEKTEDTTSGLTIKASVQFDASSATNQARLEILEVQHLR